ncbi:PR-1-like protein [Hypoxylon crocopeplum]|nr:PR-1-like protein [Hypoxylon crocopeplum]
MSTLSRLIPPLSRSTTILFLLSSLLNHAQLASSQSVVSTVIVTVAPAIPSDAPSFVDHATFTSAILNSTNVYRSTYNASSVRWNSTLESFASSYLSSSQSPSSDESCTMAHSGGPYGENLALGCSDAGSCVDMWAAESASYDYGSPRFAEATGHFTQLVWRDTTDVGCGARLCPANGGWYLACEYWPRGNVVGAFADEVGRPSSLAAETRPRLGTRDTAVLVGVAAVAAWWGLV